MKFRVERIETITFIDKGYETSIWFRPRIFKCMFIVRDCLLFLIYEIHYALKCPINKHFLCSSSKLSSWSSCVKTKIYSLTRYISTSLHLCLGRSRVTMAKLNNLGGEILSEFSYFKSHIYFQELQLEFYSWIY